MSALTFTPATKRQAKLRLALIGPAGSGKTLTALKIAKHLGQRIALIDTEHGSASKYADQAAFDVLELESFHPQRYIDAIQAAQGAGYDTLIIDSLSHAWMGKDGALQLVDQATKRQKTANSYTAWGEVTPIQNALIEAILAARMHIIATIRSKMDYVQEKDQNGKTHIRKVGLQPVQRDGLEYEFDVVADIDADNTLVVGKTRCPALADFQVKRAGQEIAEKLLAWLSDGAEPVPTRPVAVPSPVITKEQVTELGNAAKSQKIPTAEAKAIVNKHGFACTKEVTTDKFLNVLDALKAWKPAAKESTDGNVE